MNRGYLEVKDLTKTYGKDSTIVTASGGVSFSVEKGEFVAIVGASGSGKSTLMHLIGGVDHPTSGSVTVDGKEVFQQNESELALFRGCNIGLIYQFYNLIPALTAEECIYVTQNVEASICAAGGVPPYVLGADLINSAGMITGLGVNYIMYRVQR